MRVKAKLAATIFFALTAVVVQVAADHDDLVATTQHDFGSVPWGSLLVHRFAWKNPTRQPLEIAEIHCSSGVRVRAVPPVLEPGESGYIEVELDTRQFVGEKVAAVQLRIRPGRRSVVLQVHARCRPEVLISPGMLRFTGLEVGQSAERSVELEYSGPHDWQILRVENPYPYLTTQLQCLCRQAGEIRYRLTVRVSESAPAGDWLVALALATNDPQLPVIPVLVEGQICPAIEARPATLRLSENSGAAGQQRVVLRSQRPFRILAVAETPPGVTVESASDRQQPVHIVLVRCSLQSQTSAAGVIRLATDCPQQPLVEIPVTVGSLRPSR